jgi:acetyl-CoA carboxylase carboxyl transferase subunit alpha
MAAFLKRALGDALAAGERPEAEGTADRRYERLMSYGRFNDTKA